MLRCVGGCCWFLFVVVVVVVVVVVAACCCCWCYWCLVLLLVWLLRDFNRHIPLSLPSHSIPMETEELQEMRREAKRRHETISAMVLDAFRKTWNSFSFSTGICWIERSVCNFCICSYNSITKVHLHIYIYIYLFIFKYIYTRVFMYSLKRQKVQYWMLHSIKKLFTSWSFICMCVCVPRGTRQAWS